MQTKGAADLRVGHDKDSPSISVTIPNPTWQYMVQKRPMQHDPMTISPDEMWAPMEGHAVFSTMDEGKEALRFARQQHDHMNSQPKMEFRLAGRALSMWQPMEV